MGYGLSHGTDLMAQGVEGFRFGISGTRSDRIFELVVAWLRVAVTLQGSSDKTNAGMASIGRP